MRRVCRSARRKPSYKIRTDRGQVAKAISVVVPTYRRDMVLVDTVRYLLALYPRPNEILVVDQSESHEPETKAALREWERQDVIRWIQLSRPSVTHAMNVGLQQARGDIVLFVDDDIIPSPSLIGSHLAAQREEGVNIVAGQVLQPGEEVQGKCGDDERFQFCSNERRWVRELMGGNFSVKRDVALRLGGFDENFVHVAYRFEAEFCERARAAGEKILFEPRASIRHLKASVGGTRSFGHHLTTVRPSHAVGEYYYLLRCRNVPRRFVRLLSRPFLAIKTRHHLRRPWWIPVTLVAEVLGLVWAVGLVMRGPRYVRGGNRDESGDV